MEDKVLKAIVAGLSCLAAVSCDSEPTHPTQVFPICENPVVAIDIPMDFSFNNEWIVYAHILAEGSYGIYITETDGSSDPVFVMHLNPLANDPSNVRFSPDGRKLVMSRGTSDIFVFELESKELRQITFTNGNATDPDWDPSGRFVVYQRPFRRYQSDSYGLYIVDTDRMTERRVTFDGVPVVGGDPRWSPDGAWIAFWGGLWVGSTTALHVQAIRPDGSEYRDLTPDDLMRNQYPAWVNGGTDLLFLRRANTTYDYWVLSVDLEGGSTREWPLDLRRFRMPWVISRDGEWFAFTGPDESCEFGVVYIQRIRDVEGESARQVTRLGSDYEPPSFGDSEVLMKAFSEDRRSGT